MGAMMHGSSLPWVGLAALAMWVQPLQAQPKDRLVVGITAFPSNMHPFISGQTVKNYLLSVSRRLVTRYDADGKIFCQLCTEVPSIGNGRVKTVDLPEGGKGMEVTFTLRSDLRWGDGTKLTTKDIVFGAEVERSFIPPAGVTAVVASDDRSYTVKLNRVRYDFDRLSPQPINAAIEEPIFRAAKDPLDYGAKSAFNRAPNTPGLWNGPYLMIGFKQNESVTYAPNPAWDGEKPGFSQVTMRLIENTASLQANLLSGDIDLASGLSLEQALDLEKRYNERFDVTFLRGSLSTTYLYLNNDNPLLTDKRVRQAIVLGIDRQTIVDRIFAGKLPVANSIVAASDPDYDADLKLWPYDPARARALLREAGYTPGPDGVMAGADGSRLSVDLIVASGFRLSELLQQVIQSQLKQVGIEIVAKSEPARVMDGVSLPKRQFTGMVLDSSLVSPGSIPLLTFGTVGIPREDNKFSGYNYTGYSNRQLDKVLNSALVELDPAARKGLWNTIQATLMEDLPQIPLYNGANYFVSPKWLTGLTPPRSTYVSTLWIEYWKPK